MDLAAIFGGPYFEPEQSRYGRLALRGGASTRNPLEKPVNPYIRSFLNPI
jgi:hypothetical protein